MKQNLDKSTCIQLFPKLRSARVATGSLICHYIRAGLICHTCPIR